MKFCLDAGHYGKYNQSPAVKEYYESEMNWKLHLMLKKYLEEYDGVEVITTRPNPQKDMKVTGRGKMAKGCDLFISIHSNAVGNGVSESIDYPVVYVPLDGKADEIGKKLAKCVGKVMETNQDGIIATRSGKHGEYYGVIRGAASVGVSGIIIEHSFHTNTRSTKWLMQDGNLEKIAKSEAEEIASHYGLKKATAAKTIKVDLPVLKRGMKNGSVWSLQALLLGFGYDLGQTGAKKDGVDGSFGAKTEEALKRYQFENDLQVDGSCGRETWSELLGLI